jgi:Uma2 family endonuclease
MRTVLVGPPPREIEDLLERRRALGQDLFDEIWDGDYHVAPAPHGRRGQIDFQLARLLGPLVDRAGLFGSGPCNIGKPDDYRVPDQAYFADATPQAFNPTATIVVEIVSPGDETRLKSDFYHRAGVREFVIVDPAERSVEWFVRHGSGFTATNRRGLLDISAAELSARIHRP